MSNYYTTKISFWNARKKHYFEVKNKLNKDDIKRHSDADVEQLVNVKKLIDEQIKNDVYGIDKVSTEIIFDKYYKDLENRKYPPGTSTLKDYYYQADQLFGKKYIEKNDDGKIIKEWREYHDGVEPLKIKNQLLKNVLITDFKSSDIQSISDHMDKHFTVRYNEQCMLLLTRIFKYAVIKNYIPTNPCREIDRTSFISIKKNYDQNKDDPIVVQGGFDKSLKKINGLLDKIKAWNFQHYVMVKLMTEAVAGRMGEVLPLLLDDYNVGTNTIDINKTVNTGNNELHHMPKTAAGFRTVALSDEMGKLIKQLIKKHNQKTDGNYSIHGGLLFPSERNTIIQGNNFANRVLNRFNKELGIVGRINPHSFRVFVITLRDYLEHKKNNMMSDAGHASKQISDHYVRGKWVNFDKKREDANEIAGLLN